jgi:hypothetical protein
MRKVWLTAVFVLYALQRQAQFPSSPASAEPVQKSYAEIEACNQQVARTGKPYCSTTSYESWAPIDRIRGGASHLARWQSLASSGAAVSCERGLCEKYYALPIAIPDLVACAVLSVGGRTGPPFACRHVAVKLSNGWWLEGLVEKQYSRPPNPPRMRMEEYSRVRILPGSRPPTAAFDAAAPETIRAALVTALERSLRLNWHLATELRPSGDQPTSVHGVSGKRPSVLLPRYREDIGVSVFVDVSSRGTVELEASNHRRYRTKPVSIGTGILSHRDPNFVDELIRDRHSEIGIDAIMDIDVSRYATDDVTKWHALTGEQQRIVRMALNRMLRDAVRSGCTAAGLAFTDTATNMWTCAYRASPPGRRPRQ